MANSASHVVIMGDLVKSEAAPSAEVLHRLFNDAIDGANIAFANRLASPLTITLGDEFQGLTRTLEAGMTIVRHVRWTLLEQDIECRFVVGHVSLASPVNADKAWNMMGPGLATAREKLARKRAPNAYRFNLADHPALENLMDSVGLALTDIESDWTARQREVMLAAMRARERPAALVERFDVAESVFYKVRRAAKFDLYRTLWTNLYVALKIVDAEHTP